MALSRDFKLRTGKEDSILKTLVILAHPNLEGSRVNQRWKEELLKYPNDITIHEIYKEYPDWNIDVSREQNLLETYDHVILQFPLV